VALQFRKPRVRQKRWQTCALNFLLLSKMLATKNAR